MFAKTLLTTLVMAGSLARAVNAETVSSSNGVTWNCPTIETIEVAYAQSCEFACPPLVVSFTNARPNAIQELGLPAYRDIIWRVLR